MASTKRLSTITWDGQAYLVEAVGLPCLCARCGAEQLVGEVLPFLHRCPEKAGVALRANWFWRVIFAFYFYYFGLPFSLSLLASPS